MKSVDGRSKADWLDRCFQMVIVTLIVCLSIWWLPRQWQSSVVADVYPSRPIQVVVPYAAGGGSDTFVRLLQQGIQNSGELDQPLVIINQPGGIGTIGSREVKNADPDGYKILCHHNAIITAKLAETVDYGPEAFEPIALTGEMSMVVLVRADSELQDLHELLQKAAANPGTIRFAANKGAPAYYAALQLEKAVNGADLTIVSSGGGADRYTKIIGGHLDAGIFSLSEYLDFLAPEGTPSDRDIRAIAVLSSDRHESIPQVPSSTELGIPVILRNANYWWAPKGTPDEVLDRLAGVLRNAMSEPVVIGELKRLRVDPTFVMGSELDQELAKTLRGFEGVAENQSINTPRFDVYVGLVVLALFFWVSVQAGIASSSTSKSVHVNCVSPQPVHRVLAAVVFLVVVFHVLAIQASWLPLAVTISSLVLTVGLLLSRHAPVRKLWLLQLAMLTGLGVEFVFAEILKLALPH